MRISTATLVLTLCFTASLVAEEATLPTAVQKSEATFKEEVTKISKKVENDLSEAKEKYIKALEREMKNATRKGDIKTAIAIRDIVKKMQSPSETSNKDTGREKAVTDLFGETHIYTQPDNSTPLLLDDLSIYKWRGGKPAIHKEQVKEGSVAFIPTGNNHTVFDKPYSIGKGEGKFTKIAFDVYLTEKEKCLNFQLNINGGWNYRTGLDGRAKYLGKLAYPRKRNICNLKVGEWQTIEIDFSKDFNAKPGSTFNAMAFSAKGHEGLIYDNVRLISELEE